jgi:hypothetical protein
MLFHMDELVSCIVYHWHCHVYAIEVGLTNDNRYDTLSVFQHWGVSTIASFSLYSALRLTRTLR